MLTKLGRWADGLLIRRVQYMWDTVTGDILGRNADPTGYYGI
jgi:hypothetical protein